MQHFALEDHNHTHNINRFAVIPTPLRLNADAKLTGKDITIAMLDSGFYPHPDLTMPLNRIIGYQDASGSGCTLHDKLPKDWDWHGTQTSVAAAGNGYLSHGLYRSLASESNIVFVKVSERGRITEENICRGLEWILENKNRYNIRIVNISLGGDRSISYKENRLDLLAERAVAAGLILVVAAGNSGCSENHLPVPPGNAPSVITVGGYDDANDPENHNRHLYCSNYGITPDGLLKPEIIAPAMWIAAPILPGSSLYWRAQALSLLMEAPDYQLSRLAADLSEEAELPANIQGHAPAEIRAIVERIVAEQKIVATHYQHVDGTSFAAPIVSSIVAQMLQVNPSLTPQAVKNILISTADRIAGSAPIRQGYGVVNARRAVAEASRENHTSTNTFLRAPHLNGGKIVFFYHNHEAESVALVGDFNEWSASHTRFTKTEEGVWRAEIDAPAPERYRYKFLVNGKEWVEDPSNGLKELDPYGGLNSILHIG